MRLLTAAQTAALAQARASDHGRHAEIVVHDGPLGQTLVALTAGTSLGEHNAPPAASIYVLEGSVSVSGDVPVDLSAGAITALTHARHAVVAREDSVFLLTTVTGV